jgi:uncharacterized protein
MTDKTDVIVVGAGLAGLVAATELADAGLRVRILEQEGENSVGGQAYWSLGGLFLVNTPEQRRLGINDSSELALQDWMGSAQFHRQEDYWPEKVAKAYIDFAAGKMYPWLKKQGIRFFPIVGWAERGGGLAHQHGNSVPRFHITWGTGPGIVAPFERRLCQHMKEDMIQLNCRHRVSSLIRESGRITGAEGELLAPSKVKRGEKSNREFIGRFQFKADSIVVSSGGIGGNFEKVRRNWPHDSLGPPPKRMISGVPHHVDGRMIDSTRQAGAAIINSDRMWHYTEGIKNWNPIWPHHGIRIIPGPSTLWFDALGNRLPAPCFPGFDTRSTLKRILSTGLDYSWFILTQSIIEKEFALSGSEQNPDLTSAKWKNIIRGRLSGGVPDPVEKFMKYGEDFIIKENLKDLVQNMNMLSERIQIKYSELKAQIEARDNELNNSYSKDAQIQALKDSRKYLGDRIVRSAKPHHILDPNHGPLIAVRLNILTRKTLGGIHTNLDSQVLDSKEEPVPGLYAAGEAAGFGGGGYHGNNALEGTFLGGCIFSALQASHHISGVS